MEVSDISKTATGLKKKDRLTIKQQQKVILIRENTGGEFLQKSSPVLGVRKNSEKWTERMQIEPGRELKAIGGVGWEVVGN